MYYLHKILHMVLNGHLLYRTAYGTIWSYNVSICIWYEMVIMCRSAYGTKWLWYEKDFHYGTKWLWYEMTVIRPEVMHWLENWPEKIWSSISFLLLNIIDSNCGQLEISVYTLQKIKKYKRILCISINIYLYTQLPVHPRDQSLFTNLNILILHRGEKRKRFFLNW
jgi:hypothetical protein